MNGVIHTTITDYYNSTGIVVSNGNVPASNGIVSNGIVSNGIVSNGIVTNGITTTSGTGNTNMKQIEKQMNGIGIINNNYSNQEPVNDTNSDDIDSDNKQPIVDDLLCSPLNPQRITFQDVTSAAFLIKDGVRYTPCGKSQLSGELEMEIYLKKEFLQYTGSFKERGARYALIMLNDIQKKAGVIAASLGNHAQGLSYHAQQLGIPCTVVMPIAAPIMKIQKCKTYGATVIVQGNDMGEAKEIALLVAKEKGLVYINGYDHPHIMAGQGTIGLEICEQVKDVDVVIVPVGGGGLIAGIATAVKALKPNTKIIGVESEKCQSFTNALDNGSPIFTPIKPTLADGLAVPCVGYNAFATVVPLLDKMVVVKEEWIALAILRLVELEKCVVEGAGAAGLAAILAGHLDEFKNKKVVILLCGGNIDTTIFGRCLERGLAAEGRLLRFNVTVSDRPGGISELCRLLCSLGVSIKDIMHERAFIKDIYSVEVKIVCETRDWEHSQELRRALTDEYNKVVFSDVPLAINH